MKLLDLTLFDKKLSKKSELEEWNIPAIPQFTEDRDDKMDKKTKPTYQEKKKTARTLKRFKIARESEASDALLSMKTDKVTFLVEIEEEAGDTNKQNEFKMSKEGHNKWLK